MSKPRQVRGLQKVELCAHGPFPTRPKPKGKAAEGFAHQRRVHKALAGLSRFGEVVSEPWIRYSDTYGTHYCQPDDLLLSWDRTIVVESKLSLRRLSTARIQLNKLYRPVLESLFQKPVAMLLAFRYWVPLPVEDQDLELIHSPIDLLSRPIRDLKSISYWHYL